MESFESTSLWKNSLGSNNKNNKKEIGELRSAYFRLRENTKALVSRIGATLPGLTLHDISHLDALWDTASLIIGDDYPITPLEGFLLGSAFMLHDSALCFEAYENGVNGVRATSQWKDVYAEISDEKKTLSENDKLELADFAALRDLHASQAEELLHHKWNSPDSSDALYLLENQTLRRHFGKLIGQIAGSHHWNIEDLPLRLSSQQNTLPQFPRDWRADPVKLATILRCADAFHIDQSRAPDFLHALLKRNKVSLNHWKAQNRLSRVDTDFSDPTGETLLFTSTIDFTESDTDAWFVAFDAITLANKELSSCNSLLNDRANGRLFKAKRIKGIESPYALSQFITVKDWQPCAAQVHVGNIERLIENLGGEMLFGKGDNKIGVVIRELIQNGRDAIKARSYLEDKYKGELTVKVSCMHDELYLVVEDNGVGMSERVLTGPLLDFGTSFWTSSLIKSEFPGLRSSGLRTIGQFGIGFYSTFMIADQVIVTTRNWDKGLDTVKELKFDGLTLRPVLRKSESATLHSSVSTKISLRLKRDVIKPDLILEIKTGDRKRENLKIHLNEYLAVICAGLDVDLYFENEKGRELIHTNLTSDKFDKGKWIEDITLSRHFPEQKNFVDNSVDRLDFIIENDLIVGLAAINTHLANQAKFIQISTVGGLSSGIIGRTSISYIGYMDYLPKSAKREIDKTRASESTLKKWAEKQMEVLLKLNLTDTEKYCAAESISEYAVDPTPIASHLVILNNKTFAFVPMPMLVALASQTGVAFIQSSFGSEYIDAYNSITSIPGYALFKPIISGGKYLSIKVDDNMVPEDEFSVLGCLWRACKNHGLVPSLTIVKNIGLNSFNHSLNALVLKAI